MSNASAGFCNMVRARGGRGLARAHAGAVTGAVSARCGVSAVGPAQTAFPASPPPPGTAASPQVTVLDLYADGTTDGALVNNGTFNSGCGLGAW